MESSWYATLVIVMNLLRHISHRDRVPLSRVIVRILAPTGSGDLILSCSIFYGTWFDLGVRNLFPDGAYEEEGEGDHQLGVLVNCFLR